MDYHFTYTYIDKSVDVNIIFDEKYIAWFQGPQIASILGYSRSSGMYRMLEPYEKKTIRNIHRPGQRGGAQMMNLINEYGLYRLSVLSRRPEARMFQNWVYYEVLPAIREHRFEAYVANDEVMQQARKEIQCLTGVNPIPSVPL